MIHSNKKYSILVKLPEVKSGSVTIRINRDDKNLTMFNNDKLINVASKVSKSLPSEKRYEEVIVKFSGNAVVTHFGTSKDGSDLDFIGRQHPLVPNLEYIKPTNVELIAYYKKEYKRKVLYRYQLSNAYAPGNIHWAMNAWSKFFAIDTNTKNIDGVKVSITSVVKGVINGTHNGKGIYKFDTFYDEVNTNLNGNPETFAICKLISKLLKEPDFDPRAKIGIITDSEINLLDAYNSKAICLLPDVFPGLYLPDNFYIMYAAADRARDTYMPNKLMAICEKTASNAFNNLVIKKS